GGVKQFFQLLHYACVEKHKELYPRYSYTPKKPRIRSPTNSVSPNNKSFPPKNKKRIQYTPNSASSPLKNKKRFRSSLNSASSSKNKKRIQTSLNNASSTQATNCSNQSNNDEESYLSEYFNFTLWDF